MANATNLQVQNYSDQVLRPLCEQARSLVHDMESAIAGITQVYANLTASAPASTWTDTRNDGPPNLLTVANLLAINAFLNDMVTAATGDANWPIVQQACVRPLEA